jgi:type II secretory ATPase GspE/PulE/Tfp pilus assembly ATPase PilB-like protein
MTKSVTKPRAGRPAPLPEALPAIEWPLPPFYECVDAEPAPREEPAVAALRDGRHLSGMLVRFDRADSVFVMRSEGGVLTEVAPRDLLELRLTRPITLERRATIIDAAETPGDSGERQTFRVTLANDAVIEGETLGFDTHSLGLFLYVAENGIGATRLFLPAEAIKRKQIGQRLGEVLVSGHYVTQRQVTAAVEQQNARRSRKLGDYLTRNQIISRADLAAAIERQRQMPVLRLGEALVAMNLITDEQLGDALGRQREQRGKPLGEVLIDMGFVSRDDVKRTLTQQLGIPFVDLSRYEADPDVIKLVSGSVASEFNVLPLAVDGRKLVVAVENPLDPLPLDRVRFQTGMAVAPVMAASDELRAAVVTHYGERRVDIKVEDLAAQLGTAAADADAEEEVVRETDSVLVRLVNKIILDAYQAKASDIHIESNPGKKPVRVRFRQDGDLRDYLTLPSSYRSALISRIKIMAALDISERRRAQDGKIQFAQFGPAKIELRLATIPTFDGHEDAVLRILASGKAAPLDQLGLHDDVLETLKRAVARPYGILLVCGPTGSGKTTTLHAILNHINTPDLKIWTAEDPIEIQQPGLRQVQVNAKIGWSFAMAMRAFLRADPDVIMVGEMRDEETARIGIEASLTGHLVFSTLHTNSAPESIVRLLDMGVQPFNFADSLLGVLAQRLVKRLCPKCRSSEPLEAGALADLAAEYCAETALEPDTVLADWHRRYGKQLELPRPQGCPECNSTGYRGRLGIHELLTNSAKMRPLIRHSAGVDELRAAAMSEGLRTLRQDGIEKCLQGLTDLAEVRAACA